MKSATEIMEVIVIEARQLALRYMRTMVNPSLPGAITFVQRNAEHKAWTQEERDAVVRTTTFALLPALVKTYKSGVKRGSNKGAVKFIDEQVDHTFTPADKAALVRAMEMAA